MVVRRPLHVSLHVVSAGILMFVGLLAFAGPGVSLAWSVFARLLIALALLTLIGGALKPSGPWGQGSQRFCLLVIGVCFALAMAEALGRIFGVDFSGQVAAERRLPPFFRSPRHPVSPVYFRRTGPQTWTGSVLQTGLELSGNDGSPYHDEESITVVYDELGFRNETPLLDWEIAVAGDSYVELGYLPFEALFTTRFMAQTGRRVRNLGVSHTGPLSHLRYLELYGLAESTRTVCIVFYEGNDLNDLVFEDEARRKFETTGVRTYRNMRPQTSLLRAVARNLSGAEARPHPEPPRINAWLTGSTEEVPLTLVTRLVPSLTLSPPMDEAVRRFLQAYGDFAAANHVQPILVFMPCKTRALQGRIRWASAEEETAVGVLPLDLPQIMRQRCEAAGIAFCDLTPALRYDANGRLCFNALIDSHLNAEGSETVARVLASEL